MARSGTGTVLANESSIVVADTNVLTATQVVVTLSADPTTKAGGAAISHIVKDDGVGFTLYLTNPALTNVGFDYSII